MFDKILRCTHCNRVTAHPKRHWSFDESSLLSGVEWSSEDLEEQKHFFEEHRDHPLEELHVDWERYASDQPFREPIKVSYFEASNGQDRFLIKRTKSRLDRPARYEIIPGRIQFTHASISIQEEDLQRQIAWQSESFPLAEDKIKKFIEAFRDEVQTIPPEKFTEEVEDLEEGETPLLIYGSFKDARWENVFQRVRDTFRPSELKVLKEFIRQNNQPGDVLSLKFQRRFSICLS